MERESKELNKNPKNILASLLFAALTFTGCMPSATAWTPNNYNVSDYARNIEIKTTEQKQYDVKQIVSLANDLGVNKGSWELVNGEGKAGVITLIKHEGLNYFATVKHVTSGNDFNIYYTKNPEHQIYSFTPVSDGINNSEFFGQGGDPVVLFSPRIANISLEDINAIPSNKEIITEKDYEDLYEFLKDADEMFCLSYHPHFREYSIYSIESFDANQINTVDQITCYDSHDGEEYGRLIDPNLVEEEIVNKRTKAGWSGALTYIAIKIGDKYYIYPKAVGVHQGGIPYTVPDQDPNNFDGNFLSGVSAFINLGGLKELLNKVK